MPEYCADVKSFILLLCEKIQRFLSHFAKLATISLPNVRYVPAGTYLAWLEVLGKQAG